MKFHFKRINPVIILALLFIPEFYQQDKWKEYIFCMLGFGGFLLQYYFVTEWLHYQLYIIPFSILLLALLLSIDVKKWKKLVIMIVTTIVFVFSFYTTYKKIVYKIYMNSSTRTEQIKLSNWIKEHVEDGKKLYIVEGGLFYNYFLTGFLPPNISNIGYSFGPLGLNSEKCNSQISNADYILRYVKRNPYETFFTPELEQKCIKMPSLYYDDNIVLHINSK